MKKTHLFSYFKSRSKKSKKYIIHKSLEYFKNSLLFFLCFSFFIYYLPQRKGIKALKMQMKPRQEEREGKRKRKREREKERGRERERKGERER
jgi:hypothetical protein